MKRLFVTLAIVLLVATTATAGGGRERGEEAVDEVPAVEEEIQNREVIADNKVVQMHYEGTLDDGTVFDSSEGREPLEFIYGVGMLIPGLEDQLEGMQVGDRKTVRVASDDAYGPYMEEALQEIPLYQMPPELQLVEGMQLVAQTPQGPIPVTVREIREDVVVIDFNHPLAGEALTFDVEVMSVRDATEEELQPFSAQMPVMPQ
ncbi:MAG: peptidylprolyl isomerase [Spirochaetaceae bacterium]|nr:MAG: peptidylprolyl isomerase [Spirochaetaceae bacterium]